MSGLPRDGVAPQTATRKQARLIHALDREGISEAELRDIEAQIEALEPAVRVEQAARWAALEARGWKQENCGCAGGMVFDWSGNDFNGAKACDSCGGQGVVWRTPNGHYALYPGGPFCG